MEQNEVLLRMKYDKLIIDGNNFLYRAYYVQRPEHIVGGINVTPIHQFLYMMKTLKEYYGGDRIYITWDKRLNPGGPNFRKDVKEYKDQRQETEDTHKIWALCDILQEITPYFGMMTVLPLNLEADDVIGFLAEKEGTGLIVSSDKDLFQLVNEKTNILHRKLIINTDNFEQIVGVPLEHFVIYKAIMGDVSDNISGLEKHGPVRAKKLAEKILVETSVADILEEKSKLSFITEEQQIVIRNNIKLIYLPYAKRFADEFKSYENQTKIAEDEICFDEQKVKEVFKRFQFDSFYREFGRWNMLFNQKPQYNETNILDYISM